MGAALGAPLHLVQLREEKSASGPLPTAGTSDRLIERPAIEKESLYDWARRHVPTGALVGPEETLRVDDTLVGGLTATVRTAKAPWVVVNGDDARVAAAAAPLAAVTSVPVLVARAVRPSGLIIAAVDLSPTGRQVASVAASLANRFDAPLTVLHEDGESVHLRERPPLEMVREMLEGAAPDALCRVSRAGSVFAAIERAAADRTCDIVAVGVRANEPQWAGQSLAGQVAVTAGSSVLIVPTRAEREG